eukprot:TRINITY_DN8227_c0_g1_i1.p1 TRINITY_DN8227_c0_g1~~TRINITY_DN8227_c0_g1_i1.p1  ORF type:complete len:268 (+),score=58.15 TRINITY_DN8227_c0_g1_i1:69-872(+)
MLPTLDPMEIDFRRLLSSAEQWPGKREENPQLQSFRDTKLRKYLQLLTESLHDLEQWATHEGEDRLVGKSQHTDILLPSEGDIREYRRKLQYLTDLLPTPNAKTSSRVSNIRAGEPLVEYSTRVKIQQEREQLVREKLLPKPTATPSRQQRKKVKGKPSIQKLKHLLKQQEAEREKMADGLVGFVGELKESHLRTRAQLDEDKKDIDSLHAALDKNIVTTEERKGEVDDLIDTSSGLTWLYWGIIFFACLSFVGMFIFIKVTSYIPF